MNYRVLVSFVVCSSYLFVCAKKDYEPDFKEAVIKSNSAKVESLLTRKNKLSDESVKEMVAWANDIVEEKEVLERTPLEKGAMILARLCGIITSVMIFRYVNNMNFVRSDRTPLERSIYLARVGAFGGIGALGAFYWLYGPRRRLAMAYTTKFSMDKAAEELTKKKAA